MKSKLLISLLCYSILSFGAISYAEVNIDASTDAYNQGVDFYTNNNFNDAILAFTDALKFNPDSINARKNLASSYISRGLKSLNEDKNYDYAVNDFRVSLYYLKHQRGVLDNSFEELISIAQNSIDVAYKALNITPSADYSYKIAQQLRGGGQFKEAVVEYNNSLSDEKYAYSSYIALGDLMDRLDNPAQSAQFYDNALAINPKNGKLHLKFARVLNKLGNTDAAIGEYNAAMQDEANKEEVLDSLQAIWEEKLARNQDDAAAHMNLGVVYQKKGDYLNAQKEYDIAQKLDPENIELRLNMGTLLQAQGQYDVALQAYDTIIAAHPTSELAHLYKANALAKMLRYSEAIAEYNSVLSLNSKNSEAKIALVDTIKKSLVGDQKLVALSNLAKADIDDIFVQSSYANELKSAGRGDEAILVYQHILNIDPRNEQAVIDLAKIYILKKNTEEAKRCLNQLISANPEATQARVMLSQINQTAMNEKYKLAISKFNAKDYRGAVEVYKSITPQTNESYSGLAAAYFALKEYDNAIAAYKSAINLDKEDSESMAYLGSVYFTKKDFINAENYYKQALKVDPLNKDAADGLKSIKQGSSVDNIDLAIKLYNSNKFTAAIATLNKIITSNPTDGYAYYYRALSYDGLKKYSLAINDYKNALKYNAKDLNIAYYSLGIDYDILKNYVEAKKNYVKFVQTSGKTSDEYVKYAKSRIRAIK